MAKILIFGNSGSGTRQDSHFLQL